jgi:tetratricopeptide (TPR) repeat protein
MRQILIAVILAISLPALAVAQSVADAPSEKNNSLKPAEQLDQLFGKLHQTSVDSQSIEKNIWDLWARNPSPTAEVLLAQGTAAMNAHELDAAEQTLIQLVESYPDFAEGWNRRATLYFMETRYDASLVDIEHVLALEPRHFGALAGKGMILRLQGKTIEALKTLHEALEMNPHMDSVAQAIKDIEKNDPNI